MDYGLIHDISKQIKQRAHIGKIFARWHIAIAITSITFKIAETLILDVNFFSALANN